MAFVKGEPIPFRYSLIDGEYLFPESITQERVDQGRQFLVAPTDVFIVTYPKAGTTWTQKIVQLITARGNLENDKRTISEAIPWFEMSAQDAMEKLPHPRIFKSHSPWSVIARNDANPCKYIYVARNPKDSCVSLFYHMSAIKSFQYSGTWDEFVELFLKGIVETSSWYKHVKPWWEHRDDSNVLFIKYEDMKKDPATNIRTIASFIGVADLTDDEVAAIVEQSKFDNMKGDSLSNYVWNSARRKEGSQPFMRKGIVGDWQCHFSEDQSHRMDLLYEQELGASGLIFDYSI